MEQPNSSYEILKSVLTGSSLSVIESANSEYEVLNMVYDGTGAPALRVNIDNLGGEVSSVIGTHNPETTEYPVDYTGYTSGVWAIAGMVSEPFTYTTGALAGQDVSNGNGIVWDGTSWYIIADANESIVQPSLPELFEQGVIIPSGLSTSAIRSKYNASTGGNAGKAGSIAVGINSSTTGTGSAAFGKDNVAGGSYSFVSGYDNVGSGEASVAFGVENESSGDYSISLGKQNEASGEGAVAFGYNTIASGNYSFTANFLNEVYGDYATVFGGYDDGKGNTYGNTGTTQSCFIGGGYNNIITGVDNSSSIVGGAHNTIDASSSLIGGGVNHTINGNYSTIAGGSANEIEGLNGFIGGGASNTISNGSATVGIVAGANNTINTLSDSSAIVGGEHNTISTNVDNSVIIGGSYQTANQNDMVYVPALTMKSGIAPTTPVKGTMYFDGGTNQFMGYNGSTWVVLG